MTLIKLGAQAKEAATALAQASTTTKNNLLFQMADVLDSNISDILTANQKDLEQATKNHLDKTMIDRLTLTEERINAMADGIRQVATLPDPIGLVDKMWVNEDGLQIGKRRVPLGVIGIIYEARPNVTTDAAALCFKSGNAVILRGGKAAFFSSQLLVQLLRSVLEESTLPTTCIQFVEDTSRDVAKELMQLNDYLDVLIPRGGTGLIKTVVETATVPVIETGTGNCHIFVDQTADFEKAKAIIVNAKCQRPSVCNAAETLLVHEAIAERFLPLVEAELANYHVELRADETAYSYLNKATKATPEDWQTEFLDLILAVKIVPSTAAAIEHINRYSTKHSEAIISNDYTNTQAFLNQIDSAAVYVNASTRFTDGFAFGFGAEIGISTQKLHARGPMGLPELTTTKYVVYGEGQART